MIRVIYDNIENTINLEMIKFGIFNKKVVIDIEDKAINNKRIWTVDEIKNLSRSGPTSKEYARATKLEKFLYNGYTLEEFLKVITIMDKEYFFDDLIVDSKIILTLINTAIKECNNELTIMLYKLDKVLKK